MVITDKVYITDPLQEDIVAGGGQFVDVSRSDKRQGEGTSCDSCPEFDG
ncbi:MAG: hypothetical protein ACLRS8_17285 [Parabacteroides merdae]